MELLSRDRTICGGLFAAQRVQNRRLCKPNTVVIRRAGYGALARFDRVRGVRFLRLTCRAADGRAQPEMTRSGHPGSERSLTDGTPWHSPATPKSDSVRITTIPLRIACRCIVPRMVKGSMPLAACKRS